MRRLSTLFIAYFFAVTFHLGLYHLPRSISQSCSSAPCIKAINFLAKADFVNNASMNAFPMTRSVRHHLNRHYTSNTYNHTEDMTKFFNETYIERLGGEWDVKKR